MYWNQFFGHIGIIPFCKIYYLQYHLFVIVLFLTFDSNFCMLFFSCLIFYCFIPYISFIFLYVIFSLFLYISLISCACLKVIFDIPLCCPSCLAHLFLSTASLTFCLTSPRYKCFGFTHFLLSHVCNTHNPFFIAPLLII